LAPEISHFQKKGDLIFSRETLPERGVVGWDGHKATKKVVIDMVAIKMGATCHACNGLWKLDKSQINLLSVSIKEYTF